MQHVMEDCPARGNGTLDQSHSTALQDFWSVRISACSMKPSQPLTYHVLSSPCQEVLGP